MSAPQPTDLKTLRQKAGLTQTEAAKLVHRTRSAWAAYESGKVAPDGAVRELFEIKVTQMIEPRRKFGL